MLNRVRRKCSRDQCCRVPNFRLEPLDRRRLSLISLVIVCLQFCRCDAAAS